MADDFIQQIARLLGQSPDDTRRTLHALADTIRQDVENEGEAQIEGLGVFRLDGEALAFEPAPALSRAVNHRYAGLKALESGTEESADSPTAQPDAPASETPPPEETAEVTAEGPETTLDAIANSTDATAEIDATGASPSEEVADAFAEDEAIDLDLPDAPPPEPVRDLASPPQPEEASEFTADASDLPTTDEPEEIDLEPDFPVEAEVPDAELEERDKAEAEAPTDDLDVVLEGSTLDEDALVEEHLDVVPATGATVNSDDEIDALLEGIWTSAPDAQDDHPLGAPPPNDIEDVDYALVEEEADESEPVEVNSPTPAPLSTGEPESEDADAKLDEAFEPDEVEPLDVLVGAGTVAAPPPEPHDAPGFTATATHQDTAEARAPRERSSRAPVFLGLAAVVLVALGLFWFLNREPAAPAVAERPAPADTVAAAPALTPTDSATQLPADAQVDPDTPEATAAPAAPAAASSDPLRGTEGIDRAAGGFSWVIGSELARGPAERRVADFRAQGLRAGVIAEEAAGRTRYRVALGQFESIDEANRYRSELPAEAPADSWVLRL